MTLGSLAVTGNSAKRAGAGVPLVHGTSRCRSTAYLDGRDRTSCGSERLLEDQGSSGLDKPAAVIVETVQGEGGINVARAEWLRRLAELLRRHDILLIVDDIQMGCGRTGAFFTFEEAGIAAGHRHPVEVDQRLRAADGAGAHQAGAGRLGTRASTTAPSAAITRPSSRAPRPSPTGRTTPSPATSCASRTWPANAWRRSSPAIPKPQPASADGA